MAPKAAAERELALSREEANRAWQLERERAKLEATQPGWQRQRQHEEAALRATKIAAEAEERAREAAEVQAAAAKAIADADEEKRLAMLANAVEQESRAADLLLRISAQVRRQQQAEKKCAPRPQTAPRFFFSGLPGEPTARPEPRRRPLAPATRRRGARPPRRGAPASPRRLSLRPGVLRAS